LEALPLTWPVIACPTTPNPAGLVDRARLARSTSGSREGYPSDRSGGETRAVLGALSRIQAAPGTAMRAHGRAMRRATGAAVPIETQSRGRRRAGGRFNHAAAWYLLSIMLMLRGVHSNSCQFRGRALGVGLGGSLGCSSERASKLLVVLQIKIVRDLIILRSTAACIHSRVT